MREAMNEEKKVKKLADQQAWRKAFEGYLAKEEKGMDYRSFLIASLLKESIVVEQADWILERMGELEIFSQHSSGCGCCEKCHSDCKNPECECHKS